MAKLSELAIVLAATVAWIAFLAVIVEPRVIRVLRPLWLIARLLFVRLPKRIWWALYYSRHPTPVLFMFSGYVFRGEITGRSHAYCEVVLVNGASQISGVVLRARSPWALPSLYSWLQVSHPQRFLHADRGRTWIEENDPNADAFRTVAALSVDV